MTNVAFRTLCRELEGSLMGTVSGLYVCEMVTARALVERHPGTLHMTAFAPDESPRSLQLYTVDPATTYAAAKMIVEENLADHIDMNFGCPVPRSPAAAAGRPALQAAAVRSDRRRRGARHRRRRRAGDGEVPGRHR